MTERPPYGLLLRLAGPLQAWGTASKYGRRDTARFPTRSGVLGMLASALGHSREESVDTLRPLKGLSLTVRVDRPGVVLTDFHTVGGGNSPKHTVITADGERRGPGKSTLTSWRRYLADAAFTVALTSDDRESLARYAAALHNPRWPLFLGRRSCPPEGPVLLGLAEDPLRHLVRIPIAATRRSQSGNICRLEFYGDRPLGVLPVDTTATDSGDGDHHSGEVIDEPESYVPLQRAHSPRPLYRRAVDLPAERCKDLGVWHLRALGAYLAREGLKDSYDQEASEVPR